jgi:HEAT repeats
MLALLMVLLSAPTTMQPHRAKPQPAPDAGPVTPAKMSPEEVQERIQMYLGSIDRPITPGMWQRLGPAAIPTLEKIARDPEQAPSKRAGALGGISAIGSLTAPDLMLDLAKDEKQPMAVRIAAITGAGHVAPDDRVAQELKPVMENAANGHVRRIAAEVLAAHGGCDAVRAQAKHEQYDRLSKALKTCNETK